MPPINPYTAPPATLLPRSSLPVGEKSIIDAALPLLEMSYSWLFSGMRSAHAELSAVLQGTYTPLIPCYYDDLNTCAMCVCLCILYADNTASDSLRIPMPPLSYIVLAVPLSTEFLTVFTHSSVRSLSLLLTHRCIYLFTHSHLCSHSLILPSNHQFNQPQYPPTTLQST